jgi:hypothetical protein
MIITNQEKIDLILNKLDNLEKIIQSFIDNADILKNKYSLEDELLNCNAKKSIFLGMLEDLGYFEQ